MEQSQKNGNDRRVRLNKFIATCGVASRRQADELIEEGSVRVNGRKIHELGTKVDPVNDAIFVKGKPLKGPRGKVYYLFFKPKNVVTTMNDPLGRPTISDFTKQLKERVFPVGRLDWDTEGLLLLTNDGEFSQEVSQIGRAHV